MADHDQVVSDSRRRVDLLLAIRVGVGPGQLCLLPVEGIDSADLGTEIEDIVKESGTGDQTPFDWNRLGLLPVSMSTTFRNGA